MAWVRRHTSYGVSGRTPKKRQCEPVADREGRPSERPEGEKGHGCDQKLEIAARGIWLAEFGEDGHPVFGGFGFGCLLGREGGCDVHTSLSYFLLRKRIKQRGPEGRANMLFLAILR